MKYLFTLILLCGIFTLTKGYSQSSLNYQIIRNYEGNNKYYIDFLYLNTQDKIPQADLHKLFEKYEREYRNTFENKAFILYHKNEYYATFISFEKKISVKEYKRDQKTFDMKRDSILVSLRLNYDLNEKDEIICACEYLLNPFMNSIIIFKKHDKKNIEMPNFNDLPVKLDKLKFYQQFLKYGDKNKEVYSLFFDNPFNAEPYYQLYYINDYGDIVIKTDKEPGVLAVCRNWNFKK